MSDMDEVAEDLFEMANLFPASTGLPMTVWVSVRGHLIAKSLDTADQQSLAAWAALNRDALVRYWSGDIDTIQLVQQLRPLP